MIDISKLTKKDIGKYVEYTNPYSDIKLGRIKSWNDEFIFIVYRCATQWDDFNNYTGVATKPDDLQFRPMDEILYKGKDYDSSVKEVNENES